MHTYSCVRYATLPSVCTDYARSVLQADETGFYAPSVAHNALPRRPWRCISVVLSIILQTLGSFAMRSRKSMCARRPLRLRPLRCGKMCGVTCAHRWPVLTSYYVVKRCEMMCCTTYRYLYFLWKSEYRSCLDTVELCPCNTEMARHGRRTKEKSSHGRRVSTVSSSIESLQGIIPTVS